tara:strand:- start:4051 stop:4260 length:210 start_codon:yes stop_codon:yes gene_type:complete
MPAAKKTREISKEKMREEIALATEKYLNEGGTITRYEKWGKVTILKRNLDGDMVETDWFDTVEAFENSK